MPPSAPRARAPARGAAARGSRRWRPSRSPGVPPHPRNLPACPGSDNASGGSVARMAPTPLTVLTPVPLWWALWVRFTWLVAAVTGGLVQRRLRALSFIHFAHWSLVRRWPRRPRRSRPTRPPRARSSSSRPSTARTSSTSTRSCASCPTRSRRLYGGARGFPGAFRFRPVARYIARPHPPGRPLLRRAPRGDDDLDRPGARAARPLRGVRAARRDARRRRRALRARVGRFLTAVQDLV